MSTEDKRTTSHKFVMKWAGERGGKPATVKQTGDHSDPIILRIIFPGHDEINICEVSWKDFFEIFEENKACFVYQEKTADGDISMYFKFALR